MMKKITIGQLCKPNVGQIKLDDDRLIDYFDIASIDNINKKITGFTTYTFVEAPSRARRMIKKDNILVSTIRPNLNAVALFDMNTQNIPVASTGFCVLDCKEDTNPRFLFYYLQSRFFVNEMVSQATGASYPAVSDKIVRSAHIPVYSYDEQVVIADMLDKVTYIIAKRKQQLAKLDELVKARFVEMFGDPVSNPYGFEKVPLSELAEIKIGPFGSLLHKEDYIEGGHPLLNPSHIVDGNIVPDKKLTISDEKYNELEAYHLHFGDVVMGRRGEMGRCAVVMGEGFLCGTGSLLIRTRGEVTADFIQKVISFPSFKKTIEDMAVGQTMPNLNVPIVSRFQVVKPPVKVQHRYYSFIGEVDNLRQQVQKSIEKLKTLKGALMQQYFG